MAPWIPMSQARAPVTTGSSVLRGGRSMMFGSTGSTPRARAGRPSVTRLTQRIWMGRSGTGKPARAATNMTRISPRLQDSRKWMNLRMLS